MFQPLALTGDGGGGVGAMTPIGNDDDQLEASERELSGHIFSVSAGLVGVCLTVIGLFYIFGKRGDLRSWADNFLAVDAFAFLVSCLPISRSEAVRPSGGAGWNVSPTLRSWAD